MTVYRRPDPIPVPRKEPTGNLSALEPVGLGAEGLHHRVAQKLFIAISTGRIAEGGILPNEYALGKELGVSRTSLREAVKALTSKGLVETRRRRGTKVLDRSHWNMLDSDVMSWSRKAGSSPQVSADLWAAVVATQPALAGLAATRRDAVGVRAAAFRLGAAQEEAGRIEAFVAFHIEIARASANLFLASLIGACFNNLVREDAELIRRRSLGADPATAARIAELIADGQSVEAERFMRGYVETAELAMPA